MRSGLCFVVMSLLALSSAACSNDNKKELAVSVVTDFVAGPEFTSVETELLDERPISEGATRLGQATSSVGFGASFARGRSVALFGAQTTGEKVVRVTLYRPNGTKLHSRTVRFRLTDNYALTVHLTRDCVDLAVECPLANAPALTQCLMGQCVDERCNPQDPTTAQFCPEVTFCESTDDCRGVSDCSTQLCDDGICSQTARTAPDPAACETGAWCDPVPNTGGCRTLPATAGDGGIVGEVVCNTVCFVDSSGCKFGSWDCDDPIVPVCTYLGNRPAGTACGTGGVCSADGDCITESPDAGVDSGS